VAVRIAILIVLSAGVPVLLYHALEKPLISLGGRVADRLCRRSETRPLQETRELSTAATS